VPLFADVRNFTNLVRSLGPVLRSPITIESATAALRQRLDKREDNFLATAATGIFDNLSSPYRRLFAQANCEFGDLKQMVRTNGLEKTLRALRDAGVYITFDEFKGRAPVSRGGQTFSIAPDQFRNPAVRQHGWTQTGGSTGSPTRISWSLARTSLSAGYQLIRQEAYGTRKLPKARWRGLMPAEAATLVQAAVIGEMPERWFTPQTPTDLRMTFRRYPLATYGLLTAIRWHGIRVPWPEYVPLDSAHLVARWAYDTRRTRGGCCVHAVASMSLRVCLAAKAAGLDLTGVMFSGGGEPMTPAKAAVIKEVGAFCRPGYFAAETGAIGMSCAAPFDSNDQHLFEDAHALIQATRPVPKTNATVGAFNITTLLPTSTNIFINLELDDYGIVETRKCGCLFESLGLTRHVRQIRSFRKLTGEGVSLVGSDMARVLEEVLPGVFGGSPLDYQLVEEEDERGFTRLTIVVSPRVSLPADAVVIATILKALSEGDASADYARLAWQQAGTFRVARREPTTTGERGKFPVMVTQREKVAG
jgi:hypothetical protein